MSERFNNDKREASVPGAIDWYAVDFDGTLAYQLWPEPGIGDPMEDNIRKYMELADAGESLMIHSARPWTDYPVIEKWLLDHRIPFDAIVLGKLVAKRYIDDKNILISEENWF